MIKYINPVEIELIGYESKLDHLRKQLKCINKSIDYRIKQFKDKRQFWYYKHGHEWYEDQLDLLIKQREVNLLKETNGKLYTYSGLVSKLVEWYDEKEIDQSNIHLEEFRSYPVITSSHTLRHYQCTAIERLLEVRHGAISLCTGSGKTSIVKELCRYTGLKTLIIVPSTNIADNFYKQFTKYFGKKYTGRFYGGKKESDKQFIIAINNSLSRVVPNSREWVELQEVKMICADESHRDSSRTLVQIFLELLQNATYRFFFSATQFRNDGLDLVLEGITGPVVYTYDLKQGVSEGYLAKPIFTIFSLESEIKYDSKDIHNLTRKHLYYNPKVNKLVGNLANKFYGELNKNVLILVDEIEQFSHILPHLKYNCKFAFGSLTKSNKKYIPLEYQKDDVFDLVEDFNNNKIPILIGTSCISEGTDLQPVGVIINLQGGISDIGVPQSVGRGTRLVEGKVDFHFIDFDIYNVNSLHRHAKLRASIYNDLLGPIQYINL